MATKAQREALLSVACPWCGASPGEECGSQNRRPDTPGPRRSAQRRVTTLDGAAHDARWQAALNQPAPVLRGAVEALHEVPPAPEPALLGG